MLYRWLPVLALWSMTFALPVDGQDRQRGKDRQRGPGGQGMRGSSGNDFLNPLGLRIGGPLPDAQGFDVDGNPFSLSDIQGSYAVIVCGCMT